MASPPIRDFLATEDLEWSTVGGKFEAVGAAAAVPQGIRIRVGMFEGEVFLDELIGIPYIDQVFTHNPDPLIVRSIIQDAIAATPDVTDVVGAELTREAGTRDASISYETRDIYSEDTIVGRVEVPQ